MLTNVAYLLVPVHSSVKHGQCKCLKIFVELKVIAVWKSQIKSVLFQQFKKWKLVSTFCVFLSIFLLLTFHLTAAMSLCWYVISGLACLQLLSHFFHSLKFSFFLFVKKQKGHGHPQGGKWATCTPPHHPKYVK